MAQTTTVTTADPFPVMADLPYDLESAIVSFRHVLESERQALLSLDHAELLKQVELKERLAQRVSEFAGGQEWTAETRAEMNALVDLAEDNRLLLSCAKNCVSACIDLVTGSPATYGSRHPGPRPVLLETKG